VVATVLLLAGAVFAHYLVPAVALAAVAPATRLEPLVLWLSIGGLAAYSVELLSLTFGPTWIGSIKYEIVGSLVLLGPAAVAGTPKLYHRLARSHFRPADFLRRGAS
jgi:hypothetical protein